MIQRTRKLLRSLAMAAHGDQQIARGLVRGVLPAVEHCTILSTIGAVDTVIDIGANRGQFALIVHHVIPSARIHSFEPLPKPGRVFEAIFHDSPGVRLHRTAIGRTSGRAVMHVSARDDSSSLLPIHDLQHRIFPGTEEIGTIEVSVAPLHSCIDPAALGSRVLLKLDVQGYEYEALQGCESLLENIELVYCECSFVELYSGQKLASDVIAWLADRGYRLVGISDVTYRPGVGAVQADFLFRAGAGSAGLNVETFDPREDAK